jgi:hypothetical protein
MYILFLFYLERVYITILDNFSTRLLHVTSGNFIFHINFRWHKVRKTKQNILIDIYHLHLEHFLYFLQF